MKLAIIGAGFVGKAVDFGFNKSKLQKFLIDPLLGTKIEDLKDKKIDASFICVPTPMNADGTIDSSIVETCVNYLKSHVTGIIIIKSTITPDILKKLMYGPNGHRIVYNPEFLTEKAANEDFVNPKMHVFGGDTESTKIVESIYHKYSSCKTCPTFHMTAEEASFVKYGMNCFLASKVLWLNQFYDTVENFGSNYDIVMNAMTADPRIGTSHVSVPGYDGKRGFGGPCFTKDVAAFAKFAQDEFTVLNEIINRNNEYRSVYEKDEREKAQNVTYDLKI